MSKSPDLRLVHDSSKANKSVLSRAQTRLIGGLAAGSVLFGMGGVAAFSAATEGHSPRAQSSGGVYKAPLKLKALQGDRLQPETFLPSDSGVDNMIQRANPGILTDNPNLKIELEYYTTDQLSDSPNLQVGDKALVPDLTPAQIEQANKQ